LQTILAFISVVAAAIAFGQVYLMRSTAHGALLYDVIRRQGEQALRDDRSRLYALAAKPFESWSAEEYKCVERVATVLDQVGFLLKHRYVTMRSFLTWHEQVVLCFQVAQPLIAYRRSQEKVPELFLHFEWLARYLFLAAARRAWWGRRSWTKLQARTDGITNTFDLTEVASTRRADVPGADCNNPESSLGRR
jgi:hypothetical protein